MKSISLSYLFGLICLVNIPSVSQSAILEKFKTSQKTENTKNETPTAQLSLKQKLQLKKKKKEHIIINIKIWKCRYL